jgi:hypothetical protein
MSPLQPDECAAMARRAAGLVDMAALPRAGTGASTVLWQDAESVAWLQRTPGPPDEASPESPRLLEFLADR